MAEDTQQQITPTDDDAIELATLRRVNGELKTKSAARKARVSELESTVADLQSQLAASNDSLRQATIAGPLKQMSENISTAPELFLEQFGKNYRLEMLKGQLTLQTTDGKPVFIGDKPVPFEREALVKLLTDGDDAQAKVFRSIIIASRASGASAPHRSGRTSATTINKPTIQFGLR